MRRHTCDGHARVSQIYMTGIERKVRVASCFSVSGGLGMGSGQVFLHLSLRWRLKEEEELRLR